MDIYKHIVNHKLDFPYLLDSHNKVRSFLHGLLRKNPTKRMEYIQLKIDPWFEGLSWHDLR